MTILVALILLTKKEKRREEIAKCVPCVCVRALTANSISEYFHDVFTALFTCAPSDFSLDGTKDATESAFGNANIIR